MHANRNDMLAVVFFVLLGLATTSWAEESLIEESLERLRQNPPAAPDAIDFVVIADSNTLEPLEQSEVFKQSIREFNILQPDFVVQAGDIVLGGAAEGVPAQWDLFEQVIAACEPPYLPSPGNHDISDEATERIWLERIGPTHYSFRCGNSLFVLLNSEEVGAVDRISDEQAAWLKEQLDSTDAQNIFVFLHKPYFAHDGDPDDAEASWEKHWGNVAPLFRGHPVRAVFAGHEHVYRDCGVRDGVRYVICGGASVYGMRGAAEEGNFNHYLLVRVRGEQFSWAVIRPGAILAEDSVTSARIDELYNIRNKWIAAGEVPVPLGSPANQDIEITIKNPHDAPLKSSIAWKPAPGWTVSPVEAACEAPARDAAVLAFHVEADGPQGARFPVPSFRTRYALTQHGPAVDVVQDLKFVPVLEARRAKARPAIDGKLDEWGNAQMMPLVYPVGFDARDTDDLSSQLGFLWDDGFLYMAVKTHDNEFHQPYAGDIVWSADNVELFLDGWSWGLTLTEKGPEVFLYWGVDVSGETVNTDVRLAVTRAGAEVVYEAAFPQSHLKPLTLAASKSFRFNMLMNDLDPSGPQKKRHWLQLVPESGSEGSRPRVEVVLIK